ALGVDATPQSDAIARFAQVEPAHGATIATMFAPGEAPSDSDIEDGNWQPIWSIPLNGTPFARFFTIVNVPPARLDPFNPNLIADDQATTTQQYDRARYDGSMLCVAPSVWGEAVIVSDGATLYAFDRLSHRTKWITPIGTIGSNRDGAPGEDLACVAI